MADAASFAGQPTAEYAVHPEADPRSATPAIGKRNFDAALTKLAEIVTAAWDNLSSSH